jgi:CubicO group peptidase (beta-lactamase class C family)
VLGLIIEKLAGDYYEYVRKTIFDVAGMPNTRWFESGQAHPRVATGYTRHSGLPRRSNVHSLPARGSSAGGGYSTAHDLLRFALAVERGKFNAGGAPPEVRVGGLGVAGGAPGLNAVLDSGLPGGYTVVVLANYDPPAAEMMARQVRGVLGRVVR